MPAKKTRVNPAKRFSWRYKPQPLAKRFFLKRTSQRDKKPLPGEAQGEEIQHKSGTKEAVFEYTRKRKLILVNWNTEGKGSPEEVEKAVAEASDNQLPDVVFLQQTNMPSATDEESKNYRWVCSLGTGVVGSAVLINKKSKLELITHEQVCDEIIIVEVLVEETIKQTFISCCIPPSTEYRSEDLWSKLIETLKKIPSNMPFAIGGDFNACIGLDQQETLPHGCCGHLLYHELSNDNGVKLIKLASEAHLRIVSTFGPAISSRHECFTFKDGKVKSQRELFILPVSRNGFCNEVSIHWVPGHKHATTSCKMSVDLFKEKEDLNKSKVCLASWNIQGATPAKVDTFLEEQNLPIVCIQELFLTSDEDINTDHFTWLSSKKQWAKNVAILVKKLPEITVNKFEVLSECLCFADLVCYDFPLKFISCHLPLKTDPKYEAVTTQLYDLVKSIPQETYFVLAGDFNVKDKREDLTFLKKFVDDTQSNLLTSYRGVNGCPFVTTKSRSNVSHSRPFAIWIPFFVQNIAGLRLNIKEGVTEEAGIQNNSKDNVVFDSDGNWVSKNVKVEVVDGVTHKTIVSEYFHSQFDEKEDELTKPLQADIEKYAKEQPSVKELERILNGFVLFNGVNERSNSLQTRMQMLIMSFRKGNFGNLVTEHVEVINPSSKTVERTINRIKWNGILLSEVIGTECERKMKKNNANFLTSKLGQVFYTIKAKISFYCKGLPPMLMDDPRYKEILLTIKRTQFPTMQEVFNHIKEFFSKDTEAELVFGNDFTEKELEEIKEFAKSNKLGYRFFASSVERENVDNITVFINHTSQYIRDKLMETKEDLKYMLIPPSGLGESYSRFASLYEVGHFKEENKHAQNFWRKVRLQTKPILRLQKEKKQEENTAPDKRILPKPTPIKRRGQEIRQGGLSAINKDKRGNRKDTYSARNNVGTKRQYGELYSRRDGPSRYDDPGRYNEPSRFDEPSRYDGPGRYDELPRYREFEDQGLPPPKRQRQDFVQSEHTNLPPKITYSMWRDLAPLLIVWPITICSRLEDRSRIVLDSNFPVEYFQDHQGSVAAVVKLPMRNRTERRFSISVADTKNRAADIALQKLLKHSTVIKPNPAYLCDGAAPNFVRYKVPCQTYPRTYIILTQYDTGPLTASGIRDIFETFKSSFNEDVFFDKDGYTFNEKMMVIEQAPKFNLNVRHFGDVPGVANRYVCVYKSKPKEAVLEEVLKMRGAHPKYMMTTDRLPPYLGLNIF